MNRQNRFSLTALLSGSMNCYLRYWILLTSLLLLSSVPEMVFGDANDIPAGATELALGQRWEATIEPAGDVDWIK